ncbi:42322_t:CDS:2 [Gigaspora margarita]|uniref:42322_t:CDS:1 n=1 Tax=Gigaspora margarita TaxID=4874 RepID=A0ABN7UEC1_GIGMA|nr:42322_t:CDS:2 [Gigaspora margarita]
MLNDIDGSTKRLEEKSKKYVNSENACYLEEEPHKCLKAAF